MTCWPVAQWRHSSAPASSSSAGVPSPSSSRTPRNPKSAARAEGKVGIDPPCAKKGTGELYRLPERTGRGRRTALGALRGVALKPPCQFGGLHRPRLARHLISILEEDERRNASDSILGACLG